MQQSLDAMQVALRVLAAITERRPPRAEDVEELQRIAPKGEYASIDEMACRVVEEGIKRHRAKRQAKAV
jgi:hypothetical protein